jgi:hypothetical protein
MPPTLTCVILKASYIEGQVQWCADERKVFEKENVAQKEALQCEITIWSVICLSVLITVGSIFITQ